MTCPPRDLRSTIRSHNVLRALGSTDFAIPPESKASTRSAAPGAGAIPLPNKNIQNNPMQRKEPPEKKGVAGVVVSPPKNI